MSIILTLKTQSHIRLFVIIFEALKINSQRINNQSVIRERIALSL